MNSDSKPIGLIRDDLRRVPVKGMDPAPYTYRVYRDSLGQPLKTALANQFPLLSRRERRELQRQAIKAQRKAARSQQVERTA